MNKIRIVEIHTPGRSTYYVIQRKFWFGWAPAGFLSWEHDTYTTLVEAQANVKWFDGSMPRKKVVHTNN